MRGSNEPGAAAGVSPRAAGRGADDAALAPPSAEMCFGAIRTTVKPHCAQPSAAARPTTPPPTTATSNSAALALGLLVDVIKRLSQSQTAARRWVRARLRLTPCRRPRAESNPLAILSPASLATNQWWPRAESSPLAILSPASLATNQWWPRAESNHRHKDFQSSALPTELLGRR